MWSFNLLITHVLGLHPHLSALLFSHSCFISSKVSPTLDASYLSLSDLQGTSQVALMQNCSIPDFLILSPASCWSCLPAYLSRAQCQFSSGLIYNGAVIQSVTNA